MANEATVAIAGPPCSLDIQQLDSGGGRSVSRVTFVAPVHDWVGGYDWRTIGTHPGRSTSVVGSAQLSATVIAAQQGFTRPAHIIRGSHGASVAGILSRIGSEQDGRSARVNIELAAREVGWMKMFFYSAAIPNFGDELNPWLWPKVLGDCLDDDNSQIFLGIGSILWNSFPVSTRKVVFGAGYAGYTGKPDLHDGTWDVHFVRGPQTAEALNLNSATALTDAALLVRTQPLPVPAPSQPISFMPHWESVARGRWRDVLPPLAFI